jgi:hypothetical protein
LKLAHLPRHTDVAPLLPDRRVAVAVQQERRVAARQAAHLDADQLVAVPDEDPVDRRAKRVAAPAGLLDAKGLIQELPGEKPELVGHVLLGEHLEAERVRHR